MGLGFRVESWMTWWVWASAQQRPPSSARTSVRGSPAGRARGMDHRRVRHDVSLIAVVIELTIPSRLASVFTSDPSVILETTHYLRIAALAQLFTAAELVLEGALGGAATRCHDGHVDLDQRAPHPAGPVGGDALGHGDLDRDFGDGGGRGIGMAASGASDGGEPLRVRISSPSMRNFSRHWCVRSSAGCPRRDGGAHPTRVRCRTGAGDTTLDAASRR